MEKNDKKGNMHKKEKTTYIVWKDSHRPSSESFVTEDMSNLCLMTKNHKHEGKWRQIWTFTFF